MKAELINPFIHASVNLFNTFLNMDVTVGKPFLKGDKNSLLEVSAVIGLAGETQGAVVLTFTREIAVKMISNFVGHDYKYLSNEVLDGVGELVNIIVGNAKKDLNGHRISISLPGVVTGRDYKIHWPDGTPVISIPFTCSLGNFALNVSLKDIL